MTDLKNNLEEVCSCNYFAKDGKIIHSVTCKKSSFFNHEIRFGFAETGLEEIRKDILRLEQELQKAQEEIKTLRSAYKKNIDSLSTGLSEDLLKTLNTYPTALPYICELKQELQKTREQLNEHRTALKNLLFDETDNSHTEAENLLEKYKEQFKDKQGEG